jgi:hypothetical protein
MPSAAIPDGLRPGDGQLGDPSPTEEVAENRDVLEE